MNWITWDDKTGGKTATQQLVDDAPPCWVEISVSGGKPEVRLVTHDADKEEVILLDAEYWTDLSCWCPAGVTVQAVRAEVDEAFDNDPEQIAADAEDEWRSQMYCQHGLPTRQHPDYDEGCARCYADEAADYAYDVYRDGL